MFVESVKLISLIVLFICTECSGHGKREIDSGFITLEEYEAKYRTITPPTLRFDVPTTSTPKIEEVQEDPCEPYSAPKRNFNVPGRKISEIKCYEYIWDLKVRYETAQRKSKCEEMKKQLRGVNGSNVTYFVLGGLETEPGEFPHMGAIGWLSSHGSWVFKCGSSLISHKFVLTAAHCIRASSMDTTIIDVVPKIIRLGYKNIMDKVTLISRTVKRDINITRIIVHPKYASPMKYYDIALMELAEEVIFTRQVQPACLWTKHSLSELGKEGNITGWGTVESGGNNYNPELLAATIDFIDNGICNIYLERYKNRWFGGVEDHQLCAGKLTGGVDTCQGDSGGPLQVKIPIPVDDQGNMHYVVGITSFGINCGYMDTPGIYTRVSAFIDWIEPIVWPNNTAA